MSKIPSEYINESSNVFYFVDNIESELPHLLEYLNENLDNSKLPKVVNFLFGPESALKCISKVEMDIKLLKLSLQNFQKIFFLKLNEILQINEKYEDYSEDISFKLCELLQICICILKGYYNIMVHIASSSSVEANFVESLIATLPEILLEAFDHCKNSESNYGIYFPAVSETLSIFFKNSYDTSVLFHKVLDENISFNCSIESDLCLLVMTLEFSCRIGENVVHLDTKTLVEQWKGLAKLLVKHSPYIRNRLNLTQPIQFLINCLKKYIDAVSATEEEMIQLRSRNLKLGSFVLKVIVKLAEVYSGYLDTCLGNMLYLLLLLNQCSRLSENDYNEELERFIVVGAGPLLSHLARDQQFVEVFQKTIDNYDHWSREETIGLFYTHLRLFRYLINSTDSEVKVKWLGVPLISSVINVFFKSSKYLDLAIKTEDYDTYTMMVSLIVTYVMSNFDSTHFNDIECFLFTKLFESEIEVGILTSDILTLLCRFTNEDVCIKHTKYLFSVLSQLGTATFRPEIPLARTTAARLYFLLSKEGQEAVKRDCSLTNLSWWHTEETDEKQFIQSSKFNIDNIKTAKTYNEMVQDLFLRCQSLKICETQVSDTLIENFKRLLMGFRYCSKVSELQPDWWYNLFYILTRCLEPLTPYLLTDDSLEEVLNIFYELTAIGQPSTFCHITRALADIFQMNPPLHITNGSLKKVISIFMMCFSSKNILIRQLVTEKFTSIACFSNCDIIFQLDEESQKYIRDFSRKQLPSCNSKDLFYSYHIFFCHKCFMLNYEVGSSPPNKKFKPDAQETLELTPVQLLKNEVGNFVVYAKQNALSVEDRQEIRKIIFILEKL